MSKKSIIVSVALDRPLFSTFDYLVKTTDDSGSLIGCRVAVPFGQSNDIGLIIACHTDTKIEKNKIKEAVLIDDKPITSADVIDTIIFGSKYYHYPIGQCFSVAMPGLLKQGVSARIDDIDYLVLNDEVTGVNSRSKKLLELFDLLVKTTDRAMPCRDLSLRGFPKRIQQLLIDKGCASIVSKAEQSIEFDKNNILKEQPPRPNPEQQFAINQITCEMLFHVFVLNGVTGSGKTEVYLQAIHNTLKQDKSVLVLVPEIALTPQTLERFYRRFNVGISVINSSLSPKERLVSHLKMLHGHSRILIGTRSALFTPIKNLGLIVIDEEHDNSFKQSDGFRYHARSIAIKRAQLNNCPIVLGSATVSLETALNCINQRFIKIDLMHRAGGASMPDFEIIDLKNEPLTEGIKTGISLTLEEQIGIETVKGNQVLLFLNRRGYSRHLECHSCGHIFTCNHCDNPMTVHKSANKLCCHVCDNYEFLPHNCPVCGSSALLETGFGTEQVEKYLKLRYPDLTIERIDRDSVKNKEELDLKLDRIKSGKAQILLGTQMLSKGHDFPNVTLVGILDIDSGLYSDDYRSREYTLQLIVQVAGRAGRATKAGHVIIQSNHVEDPLIQTIANPHISYFATAYDLLTQRDMMALPPFTQQAFLLANASDREKAHKFLQNLHDHIVCLPCANTIDIGPVVSDKMEKRHNRYHFHILVTAGRREQMSLFLDSVVAILKQIGNTSSVRFAIEVDPQTMY